MVHFLLGFLVWIQYDLFVLPTQADRLRIQLSG